MKPTQHILTLVTADEVTDLYPRAELAEHLRAFDGVSLALRIGKSRGRRRWGSRGEGAGMDFLRWCHEELGRRVDGWDWSYGYPDDLAQKRNREPSLKLYPTIEEERDSILELKHQLPFLFGWQDNKESSFHRYPGVDERANLWLDEVEPAELEIWNNSYVNPLEKYGHEEMAVATWNRYDGGCPMGYGTDRSTIEGKVMRMLGDDWTRPRDGRVFPQHDHLADLRSIRRVGPMLGVGRFQKHDTRRRADGTKVVVEVNWTWGFWTDGRLYRGAFTLLMHYWPGFCFHYCGNGAGGRLRATVANVRELRAAQVAADALTNPNASAAPLDAAVA